MPHKLASIHTTYQVDGDSALSGVERVQFQDLYAKDFQVPPGRISYQLIIDLSITVAIVLLCRGKSMRIQMCDWTADMADSQAIIWTKQSGKPCPIKSSSSEILIESAEDSPDGELLVRVLEVNSPGSDSE